MKNDISKDVRSSFTPQKISHHQIALISNFKIQYSFSYWDTAGSGHKSMRTSNADLAIYVYVYYTFIFFSSLNCYKGNDHNPI